VSEVVCGGQGKGQQVSKPSHNWRPVEKVAVKFYGGGRIQGALAGSSPRYELSFVDGERDTQVFPLFCDIFKDPL